MRQIQTLAAAVVVTLVAAATPAAAQSAGPVQTEALRDWVAMKDRMMKIADAMPENKFDYKSTPAQRSYGEQIMHIATVDARALQLLQPQTPPPTINAKATAKAAILLALSDSFDYGTMLIKAQTNESMLQVL